MQSLVFEKCECLMSEIVQIASCMYSSCVENINLNFAGKMLYPLGY